MGGPLKSREGIFGPGVVERNVVFQGLGSGCFADDGLVLGGNGGRRDVELCRVGSESGDQGGGLMGRVLEGASESVCVDIELRRKVEVCIGDFIVLVAIDVLEFGRCEVEQGIGNSTKDIPVGSQGFVGVLNDSSLDRANMGK